jgi:hypothetical protein
MPDQVNAVSRTWRRYMRFSVRGLMVLVLLTAGAMGWIVRSARIQREAVAAIKNAGGGVGYDWEWSNGKSIPGGKPWAPPWLVDRIGIDYFGRVAIVWLLGRSKKAPDEVYAQIGRLAQTEELLLLEVSLGESGLAHLDGLTDLAALDLRGTQVPDAELAHLKRCTKLLHLILAHTKVTDVGLAHLTGLTDLQWLYLGGTHISDDGLVHLKGLRNLSVLGLTHTQISDSGLTHLKGLTNLFQLNLHGTQVTDAGVRELQRALPSLTIIR